MLVVEAELSSIFGFQTQQQQQASGLHQTMDWSSHGAGGDGNLPHMGRGGGLHPDEDVPTYVSQGDMYDHPFTLSPQSPFDMSEYHHQVEKTEHPRTTSSAEYEYMNVNPLSQVGSSLGGSHHQDYLTPPSSSFMSSPSSTSSFNNPPTGAAPGGVLEEIDGILRNFEMPQHHHHNFDIDPLYGELVSLPHQQGVYSGGHTGLGPVAQDPFAPLTMISIDGIQETQIQAVEDLAKSLQVEIMSENSQVGSTLDTCSMSSENNPYIYASASQAAMHNRYLDAGRGVSTGGWQHMQLQQQQRLQQGGQNSGQLQLVKSPSHHHHRHQQHQHQQTSGMSTAGQGGGYHNHDTPAFNFQRPSGYGPNPALAQHSLQNNNVGHQEQQHPDMGRLHLNGHHGLNNQRPAPGAVIPATGLQLVNCLLECAEAVAEHNLESAKVILVRLRGHVLPDGNPMQRLAAYFVQALRARLTNENTSPIFKGLTGDKSIPQAEVLEAFSVFYDCIPIGKFGHLTCNQILLDAVERERVVHVLDLQIWHGMQWPAFLQALALRPGGPPKLRMTALGVSLKDLEETGEKLMECARNLKVPFEFCPLLTELVKFEPSMIDLRQGEVLVVNSFVQFHCLLNKGPDLLTKILRGLRLLNPRVVAFAENDGDHNSPSFLTRFVECLRYYSAVFDAFDASLPPDSPARMKMEQIFAAQKIRNIIACEGPARVDGHETMKHWHKRMEAANFRNISLSSRAVSQANLLLNLYYSNGYTLTPSEFGYLALGWHGMPLMGVSAWH